MKKFFGWWAMIWVLLMSGCCDKELTPTKPFGEIERCDDGVVVDRGSMGLATIEFTPECLPECDNKLPNLCPAGELYWEVPVAQSEGYPGDNLCFCKARPYN